MTSQQDLSVQVKSETLDQSVKLPDLDVSVVICSYTKDRWEALVAAVESVQNQSRPPREIVVVIDHNPALFAQAHSSLPGITVLESQEAPGISGARNTGVKASQGKIIAFLDDDVKTTPDWLEQLHNGYTDPDVIGVGGAIEPMWLVEPPVWLPEEFFWVIGCTYRGMPENTAPIRNLIGANMSIRREVFSVIGGFLSGVGRLRAIPIGCEETEFCIRAGQSWPEKKLIYKPSARVFHRVPLARTKWNYFLSRCYSEGKSKALIMQILNSRHVLSSEWNYTRHTLPEGVIRSLVKTIHGDLSGILKAFAIVAGLIATTIGYLVGMLRMKTSQKEVLPGKVNPI